MGASREKKAYYVQQAAVIDKGVAWVDAVLVAKAAKAAAKEAEESALAAYKTWQALAKELKTGTRQ
jgi:hypothetical protein